MAIRIKRDILKIPVEIDFCLKSVIFFFVLLAIWLNRFLPMQDYPDWLMQGAIFSDLLKGGHRFGQYGLVHAIVPNSISTLVIGLFSTILNPELSGKIFLSLYVVFFVFGGIYFLRSFGQGRTWQEYVLFIFVFNYSFFMGNINFIFGIAILLIASGFLARKQRNFSKRDMIFLAVLFIVLYISHFIVFAMFCLFCAAIFIYSNNKKKLFLYLFLAILPSLFALMSYLFLLRNIVHSNFYWFGESMGSLVKLKTASLVSYFTFLPNIYPFWDSWIIYRLVVVIVFFALLGSTIIRDVYRYKNMELNVRPVFWAACFFAIFSLILPWQLFNNAIYNPGERFIIPAVIFFIVAAGPVVISKKWLVIIGMMSLLIIVSQGIVMAMVNVQMKDVYAELESVKDRPLQLDEHTFGCKNYFGRERSGIPLPTADAGLRLPYYVDIKKGLSPRDIFWSGFIEHHDYSNVNTLAKSAYYVTGTSCFLDCLLAKLPDLDKALIYRGGSFMILCDNN